MKQIWIPVFVILVVLAGKVNATHLLGGNLGYSYLGQDANGNNIYHIKLETYQDCNSINWGTTFPENGVTFGAYEATYGPVTAVEFLNVQLPRTSFTTVVPATSPNCSFNVGTCISLVVYEGDITLPPSIWGYNLVYDRCCRPAGILNISNSGGSGLTFFTHIPASLGPNAFAVNSSPVFFDTLVSYICINDTVNLSNLAFDPDGDSLVFSLETPHDGVTNTTVPSLSPGDPLRTTYSFPPIPINWSAGHSLANPFGVNGYAWIDPKSGITRFKGSIPGIYVIAVEIKEYRNGVFVSATRRNIQLLAVNCPQNISPVAFNILHPNLTGTNEITIKEGETVSFPIFFTDPDGNNLTIKGKGSVFDPSQTNPAAVLPVTTGSGTVISTFNWNTSCTQGRAAPYSFFVEVQDDGCPPKSQFLAIDIIVVPDSILVLSGPEIICFDEGENVTYQTNNMGAGTYNWQIAGGQFNTPTNSNTVNVDWTSTTTGQISVTYTSPAGCVKGPEIISVTFDNEVIVNAGSDKEVCKGSSVVIGGNPTSTASGPQYLWSNYTDSSISTLANPTITPDSSGFYTVIVTNDVGCTNKDSLWVTVFPIPPTDAGPDIDICVGETAQLNATGVGDFQWTPFQSINNATIANPLSSAKDTTMYIVTLTDSNNCISSDTVMVNVQQHLTYSVFIDSALFLGQDDSFAVITPMDLLYEWSPPNVFECPTCAEPQFFSDEEVEITLHITDKLGCFSFDTAFTYEIIRETAVFIPNAFSPNGDILNDYFFPVTFGIKDIPGFWIYDRWGGMVYSGTGLKAKWDGTLDGTPVAKQEIYVYKIIFEKYTGEQFTKTGRVIVVK